MTSRDDEPRGIDFEAMEAALKRAAYKAGHDTREGRFLPAKELLRHPCEPRRDRNQIGACGPKLCSMKITKEVRDYAATLGDNAKASLTAEEGMAQTSKKLIDMGAQVYVEADKVEESNKAL